MKSGFAWHTPDEDYTSLIGDRWWDNLFLHFDKLYEEIDVSEREQLNQKVKGLILTPQSYIVYEDAESTLKCCVEAGYDNYILSNNYPELPEVIEKLSLDCFFKDYIISSKVGYNKPRPEIFKYAYELAGYPEVCYMIGDNPYADVQGAKNFGIPAILVHNKDITNADYTFGSLHEVAKHC